MESKLNQKPCVVQLIQTPQGCSVSYKEHLLYSKYNPKKNIITAIEQQTILPGTIILCCSPLLGYGLCELLAKLPENCLIVLCEAEQSLFDFTEKENTLIFNDERILNCKPENLKELPVALYEKAVSGKFKRVIRIDFSAGVQFHQDFYNQIFSACSDSVMTFWKNRITLTKFGRRYSKNLFENLKYLSDSKPITDFFEAIEKPILVLGAGQSTQTFLQKNKIKKDDFYILCADTAFVPLLKNHIKPDGVFIEEAQSVITKAFIGCSLNNADFSETQIFAGLSSIPNLCHIAKAQNFSYFFTEYTKACFLDELQQKSFMPPANSPFGSVGLTAVYYALKFRKNESIPVYVCGLDFSYSIGITHTKNALAHILRLSSANRLIPIENYAAAFSNGTTYAKEKSGTGNIFVTTPTLQTYAQMFNNLFLGSKNLYDAGESGIPLAILKGTPLLQNSKVENHILKNTFSENQKKELKEYLQNEKKSLEYLKNLLTGKTDLKGSKLIEEITKIAECKEYLFLHFADGNTFNSTQSFLNRIRTEIDFFLKYM